MKGIISAFGLLPLATAWLRFGAKNCLNQCFSDSRVSSYDINLVHYCQNGREMGWCCEDDERVECSERPELEMYCNYDYPFYDKLRYFSCIRDTAVCGTSQSTFTSIPGMNQTITSEKKSSIGEPSTYGEVCRYELIQSFTNIPQSTFEKHGIQRFLRLYVEELVNIRLIIADGTPNEPGN